MKSKEAPEILDYLARQPGAQDTIEGILHWWVLEAYIQKCTPKIVMTVAQLVNKAFSKKSELPTEMYFTASPRNISRVFSNGHHETPVLT